MIRPNFNCVYGKNNRFLLQVRRLEGEMLQDSRYGLRIMSKRNITTILLSASVFSFASNTALPPRPAVGGAATKQAGREPRPIPMPDEQDVASALNVEIEKLDGATFKLADFRCGESSVAAFTNECQPPTRYASRRFRQRRGMER